LSGSIRAPVTCCGCSSSTARLDPTSWIDAACRLAGRNLTAEEWATNIGDLAEYGPDLPAVAVRWLTLQTNDVWGRRARHHRGMVDVPQLLAAVDGAFAQTGAGAAPWPDPHPDRSSVPDEAYSRLTNPAKWRILGARTDAWLVALVGARLAIVEPDATVTWKAQPAPVISRAERVVPRAAGALELVIAHSRLGDVDDAGVGLGVGDPVECVEWFPDCGCDACDSGSQNELEHLDAHLVAIVSGAFRRLSDGRRDITVLGDDTWSATGFGPTPRPSRQVESVLANPVGWTEITGTSWLDTGT
jgi:hypothetical protein